MDLNKFIRDVPDYPKPGILFKDITPLLGNPDAFRAAVDLFVEQHREDNPKIDKVVGIESRGFIFGAAIAHQMGVGFVPVRKLGKLPYKSISESYALEYGQATLEIHEDAIRPDERVLIVDDLLATGGTLVATCNLVERLKGKVAVIGTLIELTFLGGRKNLGKRPYYSFLKY